MKHGDETGRTRPEEHERGAGTPGGVGDRGGPARRGARPAPGRAPEGQAGTAAGDRRGRRSARGDAAGAAGRAGRPGRPPGRCWSTPGPSWGRRTRRGPARWRRAWSSCADACGGRGRPRRAVLPRPGGAGPPRGGAREGEGRAARARRSATRASAAVCRAPGRKLAWRGSGAWSPCPGGTMRDRDGVLPDLIVVLQHQGAPGQFRELAKRSRRGTSWPNGSWRRQCWNICCAAGGRSACPHRRPGRARAARSNSG
jgi:hypothetical protein